MTSPEAVRAVIAQMIVKWRADAAGFKARAKALSDEGHDTWSNGYSGEAASRLVCADELEAALAVEKKPKRKRRAFTDSNGMRHE